MPTKNKKHAEQAVCFLLVAATGWVAGMVYQETHVAGERDSLAASLQAHSSGSPPPTIAGDVPSNDKPPPAGYCVWGQVVEVHDGDTVVFRVTHDIPVRILGCWAPEVTGAEKSQGIRSRDHLAGVVGVTGGVRAVLPTQNCRLVVPLESKDKPSRTDKYTSMGRVLGHVYVGDKNLSTAQVAAKHAKAVKVE